MSALSLLSIVIPVFNEEDALPLMKARLDKVLPSLGRPCEIILIDDGSRDRTRQIIKELAASSSAYKAIVLSRNYGHQIALTAGLDFARGDAVVVMDADLQDPPELIIEMLKKWKEGNHVVYGKRLVRHGETFAKKITAAIFYQLLRLLSGYDIPQNTGDFRLMDRKVVDALKKMPEKFRFVRGMVAWAGFRQCSILFERPPRVAGITKYSWGRMFRFAFDAIFSFSVVPLRLAMYLGVAVMGVTTMLVARILYLHIVKDSVIPGFTALFILIAFLGGINLMVAGILGEYIGRIYVESKARPLYFVEEIVSQ